jgi:hypothetical protein
MNNAVNIAPLVTPTPVTAVTTRRPPMRSGLQGEETRQDPRFNPGEMPLDKPNVRVHGAEAEGGREGRLGRRRAPGRSPAKPRRRAAGWASEKSQAPPET